MQRAQREHTVVAFGRAAHACGEARQAQLRAAAAAEMHTTSFNL
tara:strand:- start:218 stop:349 length:132 start_codon:yes stop_codon:yes gene_type:complete